MGDERPGASVGKGRRRDDRAEVARAIGGEAPVDAAVEVHGEARDERDRAVKRHEPALHAAPDPYEGAARERERAVEPRVIDHAPVGLDVQALNARGPLQKRVALELERGRVAVRRGDLKMVTGGPAGRARAHRPRDDARGVAARVIAPARLDIPCGVLGEVREPRRIEPAPHGRRRVEHAGAFTDERHEPPRLRERVPVQSTDLICHHGTTSSQLACWLIPA